MKASRVSIPSQHRVPCPNQSCAGMASVYANHLVCDGYFTHTYRRRELTVELARKIDKGEAA